MSWGPSHQTPRSRRWGWRATVAVVLLLALLNLSNGTAAVVVRVLVVAVLVWRMVRFAWPRLRAGTAGHAAADPLEVARSGGPGVYLGVAGKGVWRRSRPQRAVLVLGPPRSGKTSAVIIPTVLSHQGPVVSTSTKADVMSASAATRGRAGRVWMFDPTGTSGGPGVGVERLRWSPLTCSREWDGALLMARAMVTGASVGTGTTDATHWARRAQALLAPLLHAAALAGLGMGEVVGWVMHHDVGQPATLLEQHQGSPLAAGSLVGVGNTDGRERSSIFSAAADALDAYTSQAALAAAEQPNFFAGRFVRSQETIFIHAPAEHQHLAAPLVCGLLAEVRRATYELHRENPQAPAVLFALDEVANIAPVAELPQIASEGGSQGLLLLAAIQDLSQARQRWGEAADGFLTLFGDKLILPGVADHKTLEAVSVMLGEYDRTVVSETRTRGSLLAGPSAAPPQRGETVSTQRTRVLSPGEVANIPAGHGLHLDGVRWELLTLTPAYQHEPWRTLTTPVSPPPR